MTEFNLEEWKRQRAIRETCPHDEYHVGLGYMVTGKPIYRFKCVVCGEQETSVQMTVDDLDRKIASVKHEGKTIREIAETDMKYLLWVATKSKLPQADRYACARVCAGSPYSIPQDGQVVRRDETYAMYVKIAKDFITSHQ